MRRMIEIAHHQDDYECMWNGIEALYTRDTKEKLPPSFFFVLASFGSFCYMKTSNSELKRMLALGDGRTKQMYAFLAPIVGFDYKHCEYSAFTKALSKAKAEIDAGFPCVLGALDMYYLPYFAKLYHTEHVPFHYVLMVGYDDDAGNVYINDCGRQKTQPLPYDELRLAWDCAYPGLSKPNTVCTVRMHTRKNKYEIAREALAKKREAFLNPPVGFIGARGFEKFILELPKWKSEFSKEEYDKLLFNMVQFFGTVPTIPNALLGVDEPDEIAFGGGFDKASVVLSQLGMEYSDHAMAKAAATFGKGAAVISKIKDVITNYLSNKKDETAELPALFADVLTIMKNGFTELV